MRALGGFILQGRTPALLVVTGTVVVPLLAWLSVAALALVTLRRGPAEGGFLVGLATLTLLAATLLTGASPVAVMIPLAAFWLPTLLASAVLRQTVSWAHALQALASAVVLAMLAFHGVLGDAGAFWAEQLDGIREELRLAGADQAEGEQVIAALASRLTGVLFGGLVAVVMGGLVLARYWQAVLFNPGGFQREFHGLRLQSGFALGTLALLLASGLMGPGLVNDAASVMITIFMLQGLAVIHAVAWHRGWRGQWLVPVYVLLPVLGRLIAFVGLLDVFADLRRRAIGPTDHSS